MHLTTDTPAAAMRRDWFGDPLPISEHLQASGNKIFSAAQSLNSADSTELLLTQRGAYLPTQDSVRQSVSKGSISKSQAKLIAFHEGQQPFKTDAETLKNHELRRYAQFVDGILSPRAIADLLERFPEFITMKKTTPTRSINHRYCEFRSQVIWEFPFVEMNALMLTSLTNGLFLDDRLLVKNVTHLIRRWPNASHGVYAMIRGAHNVASIREVADESWMSFLIAFNPEGGEPFAKIDARVAAEFASSVFAAGYSFDDVAPYLRYGIRDAEVVIGCIGAGITAVSAGEMFGHDMRVSIGQSFS